MSRTIIWPAAPDDACAHYRLLEPARVLADEGADVSVPDEGPKVYWDVDWSGKKQAPPNASVKGLAVKPDADTVVFQRPGRRWMAELIPFLQNAGIRVVVDIDDHFARIDRTHAAWQSFNTDTELHHHSWVAEAARRADLVTVSTPVLADYYGFGHALVLPNLVPESYLKVDALSRPETMMWTGHLAAHPTDLQVTRGAVGEALQGAVWRFCVLGDPWGIKDALGLAEEPDSIGWVPFSSYASTMAEAELGIVPLADSVFNTGKSCLKMMEFAAVGVPVLASATPDNLRLHKLGIGNIVKAPHQWRKGILRLIGNEGYREDSAGSSREAMAELTYEKQAWRWAEAWGLK